MQYAAAHAVRAAMKSNDETYSMLLRQ